MSRPGVIESERTTASETPTPSKTERLAALQEATATARAGISRYQRQKLVEWWTRFKGSPPDETISAEEMARQFLDPPCQWTKGSPLGFLAVTAVTAVINDGKLKYLDKHREHLIGIDLSDEDVRQLLEGKAAALLPCVTVRVLVHSWRRTLDPTPLGCRGELVLYRGAIDDRFLEQAKQLGQIEIVQEVGRYAGKPESLGQCPTPREIDPAGRTYLTGYKNGAVSKGEAAAVGAGGGPRVHEPLPRSLDALLPEPPKNVRTPTWDETPPTRVRANLTTDDVQYFPLRDGQIDTMPAWLAGVLCCRRTRHNEPFVSLVDEPTEPLQRFIADVEAFTAANPGAKTDHPAFPVFCAV